MTSIQLSAIQREQMTGLIGQLATTRTVAEAFVGYFAKELGVNLQLYQFNADTLSFEPVGGAAPAAAGGWPQAAGPEAEVEVSGQQLTASSQQPDNGKVEVP